jgi:hypothetical protein
MFASIYSATGNVIAGNIRTAGQITATGNVIGGNVSAVGNIVGSYLLGNGSQITGLASTNSIQNGNSNVLIGTVNGNVSINVTGTSPLAIFTPLGQTTTGIISATGTVTAGNIATGGTASALGNVTGGNIIATANLYYNGNVLVTRSLTVGTRSTPATIPLTANGSFSVGTRSSGNVTVTTSA